MKVPPHDIKAEQSLLGALIMDSEIYDDLSIGEEDFYAMKHKIIFECIDELIKENKTVDLVTVLDKLDSRDASDNVGGVVYLNDCITMGIITSNALAWEKIQAGVATAVAVKDGIMNAFGSVGDFISGVFGAGASDSFSTFGDSVKGFIDAFLNATVGSIIFLEPPRYDLKEILFTGRVSRWNGADNWRGDTARYFCKTFLDPFDIGGHCA